MIEKKLMDILDTTEAKDDDVSADEIILDILTRAEIEWE